MANINNNTNNDNSASSPASSSLLATSHIGANEILSTLSTKVLQAYQQLAADSGIRSYELTAKPVSGIGENAYGLILQVCVKAKLEETETDDTKQTEVNIIPTKEFINILKISPKNPAFRAHGRIVELYQREAFMYQQVFPEFLCLHRERLLQLQSLGKSCDNFDCYDFNIVPDLIHCCLDPEDEFFIFEDLSLSDYKQNLRTDMPTFELVAATFRSIAKFHAMSFVLQAQKPQVFCKLVQQMDDNLFIENMEPITVEFGKKYIRKTRVMLEHDIKLASTAKQIEALHKLEKNFKEIAMQCVNGKANAPYAVICHGDFWNNNMLYKYDTTTTNNNTNTSAKLIDFQLSRYASPILDLVHYLYTCTERELRKKHFPELIEIYYQSLSAHIEFHNLQMDSIYPRNIFMQQLKEFGIFGFCMAAFSIPFFISNTTELPNLDEVATAIREISSNENSDEETEEKAEDNRSDAACKRLELLDEYDILTERTLPIFKRRMCDIVKDLEKYQMLDTLLEICQ